ncbi:MAG: efflux RND transporter periplasmic adaptor subunit [Waterburya sp.]
MKTAPKKQQVYTHVKPNPYRRAIPWLVWSGILGITIMGGWLGYEKYAQQESKPVSVKLHSVKQETIETTVSASGTVELGRQQTLKSPKEVTVEEVKVKEGDRVSVGQPLIILRDRTMMESYQDQIVENNKTQLELNRRLEKVVEATEQLTLKETRLRESQRWQKQGVISRDDLQTNQDNLQQALSQLKDAQVEAQKAELDVNNGQQKLIRLEQQLSDRIVKASINGVVLKVYVKNGDGTKTESNLLTIGDPSQEIIRVQLTTLNALQVKLNQTARITIIGPQSQTFTGKVISLSPQAIAPTTSANAAETSTSSNEPTKVDTKVLLDRPSNTLIPGSVVSVEIVTAHRQNSVAIPPEALQRAETQSFVWIQDRKGKAKKQPVTLGLQSLNKIEITSGLQPGDKLVLPPPNVLLTPATNLEIRK